MDDSFKFNQVAVVSDLHLGGDSGFQIFNQGPRFAAFIDKLIAHSTGSQALVINGDMVDFLAEPEATYFDPAGAVAKLARISTDDNFRPVFDALRKFVQTPGNTLAITLGNHDLELSLPWVRKWLLDKLSGGDEAARGRIVLSFEGAGFRCKVGNSNVLCLHGNEVDPWNVTDYETLRRAGRDGWADRGDGEWIPNGGTQLVIEVMNGIKKDFRFVDLLKPETGAVPKVIWAIDPGQYSKVSNIVDGVGTFFRKLTTQVEMAFGFLGENSQTMAATGLLTPATAPGFAASTHKANAAALLLAAEDRFRQGVDPYRTADGDRDQQYLGTLAAGVRQIFGKDGSNDLRDGLQKLANDRSFDISDRDDTAVQLDRFVGSDIDILVAGHTHLRRALRRSRGTGFYYNTGTWVRLMAFDKDTLADETKFADVIKRIREKKIEPLDDSDVVKSIPTVLMIRADGNGTVAELQDVAKDGTLSPVADTRFPKV